MIKGLSFGETERYISEFDSAKTEEDGATIWVLGNLDARTRARLFDDSRILEQSEDGTSIRTKFANRNVLAVRYGLRDVINFMDESGKQIPFRTDKVEEFGKEYVVVADSVLDAIPPHIISELAEKILKSNQVLDELRKNSLTQSSQ